MTDIYYDCSKNEVSEIVWFLKNNLSKKPTQLNYQLTHYYFNAQFNISIDIEKKLQTIADLMRIHLLITEPIKVILLSNIDAGKFQTIDGLNCIFINASTVNQTFKQKVAILAHEMSHYQLIIKHGIEKKSEKENELLTEINAIYCGFGFLLLEGYKFNEVKKGNEIFKSKVGYIDTKVVKEAIVQTAYIRKQKPQWIIDNVQFNYKLYFYFRLFKLFIVYKKAVKKSIDRNKI
ncbi:hypothetical protein ACNQGB_01155 [Flavobacterium sp. XS1P32]|uniref:hypothetical protein n=1 Tax=Flavobacterium sp. XS1P32 TaxID=3401726 RepID=UPI003AAE1211